MAETNLAPAGQHDLTTTGLRRLIAKLREELALVEASSASPAAKARVAGKVRKATDDCEGAIALIDANSPVEDWFGGEAGRNFQELSADLKQILGTTTGACVYTNPPGCINTSGAECSALGGTFHANLTCDSMPPI